MIVEPIDPFFLFWIGDCFFRLDKFDDALRFVERATIIDPNFADAHAIMGGVLCRMFRFSEGIAAYDKALMHTKDHENALIGKLFNMNYLQSFSRDEIFKIHANYGLALSEIKSKERILLSEHRSRTSRIKIGYVSADFRNHSVAFFAAPLIKNHNKEKFEITCYYNDDSVDKMTSAFRNAADRWRKIKGKSDTSVADMIVRDQIDILVDLSGQTSGHRLPVFAMKPAPIQLTWLGYANTTGLREMDYRLVDNITDPEGSEDEFYTEMRVRLPNIFLCYEGDRSIQLKPEIPANRNSFITFGCFNNTMKISDANMEAWAEVLKAVPKSKILIKSSTTSHSLFNEKFISVLNQYGIEVDRFLAHDRTEGYVEHLRLYDNIDIALDTFPYNGTTTTCEALWMGVPVVALRGDRHISRVSASILTNVGLAEYVAEDLNEYIAIAVKMANDLKCLSSVRKGLRKRLENSTLCDAKGFCRDVEAAYEWMHKKLEVESSR